jgi:hypothetical protein
MRADAHVWIAIIIPISRGLFVTNHDQLNVPRAHSSRLPYGSESGPPMRAAADVSWCSIDRVPIKVNHSSIVC